MPNYKSLFISLFFLFSLSYSSFSQSHISQERLTRYEEYFQKEIDAGRLPGIVTLIYQNGAKVHESALGFSDLSSRKSLQKDQIFFIQSMTKPIITTAFMMLYEEGHFFLNDPISKYLPEFKEMKVALDSSKGIEGGTEPARTPITIAQVLSHTAGFSHGLGGSKLDQEVRNALYGTSHPNLESRVKALANLPLVGQPGKQWYYSASPDILARLIEVISGTSPDEFLKTRLFDPLGMKDTGYSLQEDQLSRMTQLHIYNKEGKLIKAERQTPTSGNTVFGGTHGLFSTAQDYSIFARMLLNNGEWNGQRYLSPKTLEIMTLPHDDGLFGDSGKGFGYGFAVIDDLAATNSLGSEGTYYWNGAYSTYFFIDPKENLVAIFMTQLSPFSSYYENKFRQMVYQAIE
jgi:CubicO group peptidase (beta-lactamase class C family)